MNKLCGRKENFYSKTESNSLSSHEPVHSHNCVVQQGFHITTTWRESGKCSDLQTCKHGHDFTRRAWVLFSNASHTSCMQWVTATTGHCYLITNKRDVPSVRFQKFPAKQTAISASQTLALLSTGGADFVPGFTHHLALQSNFPLSGQASSWSGDNFETATVRKQERDRDCWHRLLVIHGSLQQMETERLLALWSKVGLR